jgi:hypothetical protein
VPVASRIGASVLQKRDKTRYMAFLTGSPLSRYGLIEGSSSKVPPSGAKRGQAFSRGGSSTALADGDLRTVGASHQDERRDGLPHQLLGDAAHEPAPDTPFAVAVMTRRSPGVSALLMERDAVGHAPEHPTLDGSMPVRFHDRPRTPRLSGGVFRRRRHARRGTG